MSDARIFIGLGGNLGNPKDAFLEAVKRLSISGVNIIGKSRLYRTKPYGYADQPDFLNAAIEIRYGDSAWELLRLLQEIEQDLGKNVLLENGPRMIDLDLLLFGSLIIHEKEDLILPHPGVVSRDFVLLPLCDLAPELAHPQTGKTLMEHLSEISENYDLGEREDW